MHKGYKSSHYSFVEGQFTNVGNQPFRIKNNVEITKVQVPIQPIDFILKSIDRIAIATGQEME